jgi:5-methylcytosine-specific restriction protein A
LATAGRDARAIRLEGVSEMGTFILTWNPQQWDPDGATHQADLTKFRRRGSVRGQWSVGNRKRGIGPGDRAFLLRQHEARGLVASGHFTSPIFREAHWDGTNRDANYAKTEWDAVVDIEDCLPTEGLKRRVTPFAWDRIQASGIRLPDQLAGRLEDLWRDHLSGLGLAPISIPEEVAGSDFAEGAVQRVTVNRYERDPRARAACLQHFGTTCSVCAFDFEVTYGQLGRGYIHVHHLRDLSSVGPGYRVDPVQDLRPVCPNCHAMLHQQQPALTIAALRRRLRAAAPP